MKALVKVRNLPPAPAPTLPRGIPEWLIKKETQKHQRCIGMTERRAESRKKGQAISSARKRGRPGGRKYDHQKIYELRDQGMTTRQIAAIIGCNKSTVCEALMRRPINAANQNN